MRLIREMSLVKYRVKALLVKHPHLRDSDNKLIATMWKFDLNKMGLNPHEINGIDVLTSYANSELTNTETIRRVRQKIQEENPELRGTVNEARREQGEEVKQNINT